jgi:hypothetical protein
VPDVAEAAVRKVQVTREFWRVLGTARCEKIELVDFVESSF